MVLDSGDTAWMLVAGSLVLLMIPALGLFESGLLRKKNAASIFMQIFFGLAMLSGPLWPPLRGIMCPVFIRWGSKKSLKQMVSFAPLEDWILS